MKEIWQQTKDEFIQNIPLGNFSRVAAAYLQLKRFITDNPSFHDYDPKILEVGKKYYEQEVDAFVAMQHKEAILDAMLEGKEVPEDVLKDYPDIVGYFTEFGKE